MELRHLRYVAVLARRLSFTQAARELSIAQPALSQQIAALERELGVRLFDRGSRQVALTDAGRMLAARAEGILAQVACAASETAAFASGRRGRVLVGTHHSFSAHRLPKLLGWFKAEHPDVEVTQREALPGELLPGLRSGAFDVIIGNLDDAEPGICAEFDREPLYDDELAIALGARHRLARGDAVEMRALRDEPWVIFHEGSSMTALLHELARSAGFAPRILFESADSQTVRALVAEGLGVALFPRLLGNTPGPNIALASLAPRPLVRTVSLFTRKVPYGPAASTFLAFLRERLSL